jgi:hypothetical protein
MSFAHRAVERGAKVLANCKDSPRALGALSSNKFVVVHTVYAYPQRARVVDLSQVPRNKYCT